MLGSWPAQGLRDATGLGRPLTYVVLDCGLSKLHIRVQSLRGSASGPRYRTFIHSCKLFNSAILLTQLRELRFGKTSASCIPSQSCSASQGGYRHVKGVRVLPRWLYIQSINQPTVLHIQSSEPLASTKLPKQIGLSFPSLVTACLNLDQQTSTQTRQPPETRDGCDLVNSIVLGPKCQQRRRAQQRMQLSQQSNLPFGPLPLR